jgi:hypothetical protein
MKVLCFLTIFGSLVNSAFGADPWKDKKPADWTEKDLQQILNKSPWAKTVSVAIHADRISSAARGDGMDQIGSPIANGELRGALGVGTHNPISDGNAGGAVRAAAQSHRGGADGAPMPHGPVAIIRWESSPLIRAAVARVESQDYSEQVETLSKEFYVISVTAVWGGFRNLGWRGRPDDLPLHPPGTQSPAEIELQEKSRKAKLIFDTYLKSSTARVSPVRVEFLDALSGPVTLYLFPRSLGLEQTLRNLELEAWDWHFQIKTTFDVREMTRAPGSGL